MPYRAGTAPDIGVGSDKGAVASLRICKRRVHESASVRPRKPAERKRRGWEAEDAVCHGVEGRKLGNRAI
jgi:hypothetical protein